MLTLPLEPTDDRADPIFKDAAGCAQWLGQLQLTNLQLAHSLLLIQINELNHYPMRSLERLNTLELLRETVGYVQDDYAKKLIAKPLPLNESELMVFVAIVQLWQAMVLGYQRCLQAYMAGDKQLAKHGALLCQRGLLYSGLEIFEHLRTGYEFESRLWHQLNELYAFAEQQNLQSTEVPDPLNGKHPHSSCHSIYVKTLLACHARPAELSRSQLQLMDDWLAQWSDTITIENSYAISKGDAQPPGSAAKREHYEKAIQGLSEYAALVPDFAEPDYVIATLYQTLGDAAAAKEWAAKGLAVYETDTNTARRASRYYITAEDWDNARRFLADLAAAEPENYPVLYDLAKAEFLAGNPERARDIVRTLREKAPGLAETDPAFLRALGER